ncbi:MAG: glycosyltransferase family 2 protein [Saprospiraceae bacterium]|nr:glycosyltransferase family 2 protein [Saprospiraceae bacterium]
MKRKFTIIIPTKDRAETLQWTLTSCLAIQYPDFEIVISDNCSEDDTYEVVHSFKDERIKYYRTPGKLGMTANWEFALSKVNSGMVTILGDDDAFLPDSLLRINDLLNQYQTDAISWQQSFYRWPNNNFVKIKNLLSIPNANGIELRKTKDVLEEVLNLKKYPGDLPWLYAGFVNIDTIRNIQNKSGGVFFHSKIPDIYSAMVLSSAMEEYVYSHQPLSIAGHSAKSNGAAQIQNKEEFKEQNNAFIKESESHPFHSALEFVHVYPVLVWETYLQAKDQGVMRSDVHIHPQFLLDRAVKDCIRLDFLERDIEKLKSIALKQNVKLNIPVYSPFIKLQKKFLNGLNYLKIWTNNVFIPCGRYNISNVHEASLQYRNFESKASSRPGILFHNIKLLLNLSK